MEKIVVLGGGTMGLDIVHVFARSGKKVVLRVRNMNKPYLANLTKTLDKLVSKGKMDEDTKAAILANVTVTDDMSQCADADLVLEALAEDIKVKAQYFSELDEICKPECIFATNTSSISITEIAAATKRPDRVIGMHFFNPATVMKLVEVIRGMNTSDETFKAVYDLTVECGKDPVEVAEAPGYVVNRILFPMINEAIGLLEMGVASAEDIDKAMRLGANHPMGPLALADLVGLDISLAIMDTIYAETCDSKYRACLLLRKMVRAGLLGRKTGKGFYDYSK
ncbi:MAG: 3-hydroxybutyryl-CoA dehydrogenase [Oscillospiraceae bacterium]|nr:3-hydroxybutyryl-CoA dehydrogenase [Oscillospiraceae bacterium]